MADTTRYGDRSMSGRYASYWNAFLLKYPFEHLNFKRIHENNNPLQEEDRIQHTSTT